MTIKAAGNALCAMLIAGSVHAHDFWLEPSSFKPAAGDVVAISLLVGENMKGDALPRRPQNKIMRFAALDADGERPIAGLAGAQPAGRIGIRARGLVRVIYRGAPGLVTLEAEKFEKYLREEGLDRVVSLRASRGETGKAGRELFSRSARCLIRAGGGASQDEPAGLPLEIIAETNPYEPGGDRVVFRVLYEGAPLARTLVVAMNGGRQWSARSDAAGRVTLPATAAGLWLVKTVHMVEAAAGSGADWHSLWASLTFER